MMVCHRAGYSDNNYYYGECYSTDNTSFSTINFRAQSKNSTSNFLNSISMTEIFNNKWVLFDSKMGMFNYYSGNFEPFENYIFYKVSSD